MLDYNRICDFSYIINILPELCGKCLSAMSTTKCQKSTKFSNLLKFVRDLFFEEGKGDYPKPECQPCILCMKLFRWA